MGKRDPEREAQVRRTVAEWERSGKTAPEFCRDRGLSTHTLYGWRRELRERNGQSPSSGTGKRRRHFVQVQVTAQSCLELCFGGDLVLRVPSTVDADRLAEILAAARKSVAC